MPSANTIRQDIGLPLPRSDQVYVTVSALDGGHLTLPEHLFVTDADPNRRVTVPSLSFLIQHPSRGPESPTRLLFDLGMKRNPEEFPSLMQTHIRNRQPTILHPDVGDSLRAGGLDPAEIEMVILSHVHWDHVGTPADFTKAQFLAGAGTLHLLRHGAGPHYPAEIFIPDLLPEERTQEFPPANTPAADPVSGEVIPECVPASQQSSHTWQPLGPFASAIDLFADGSVYVIDSPGHMIGHVNLLARVSQSDWVYLGGDCCHDPRILNRVKDIALYDDGHGGKRSVHVHTAEARETLSRVQKLVDGISQTATESGSIQRVEVVIAHDCEWREKNPSRFFPGSL